MTPLRNYRLPISFTAGMVLGLLPLVGSLNSAIAQSNPPLYNPITLPSTKSITDTLTDRDIPTGQGGFARDYLVELEAGEQVAIDLRSDNFDTVLILLADDGSVVAENDDGPDGGKNSLLFARISETGSYTIRVRSFGKTGQGEFRLQLTRLEAKE